MEVVNAGRLESANECCGPRGGNVSVCLVAEMRTLFESGDTSERTEYTAVGDRVNVATRLQKATPSGKSEQMRVYQGL